MNRRQFIKNAIIGGMAVTVPIPRYGPEVITVVADAAPYPTMWAKASIPGGKIFSAPFVDGVAVFKEHLDPEGTVWVEEITYSP